MLVAPIPLARAIPSLLRSQPVTAEALPPQNHLLWVLLSCLFFVAWLHFLPTGGNDSVYKLCALILSLSLGPQGLRLSRTCVLPAHIWQEPLLWARDAASGRECWPVTSLVTSPATGSCDAGPRA